MPSRSPTQRLLALQERALDLLLPRLTRGGVLLGLRLSLASVYLWFGALKFFQGLSPAEDLAGRTLVKLSLGLLPPHGAVLLLAGLECAIALGLLTAGRYLPLVVGLLLLHMAGTFTPVLLFPREIFVHGPFGMSLEGQYIAKNAVIVAAAFGMLFLTPRRGGTAQLFAERYRAPSRG